MGLRVTTLINAAVVLIILAPFIEDASYQTATFILGAFLSVYALFKNHSEKMELREGKRQKALRQMHVKELLNRSNNFKKFENLKKIENRKILLERPSLLLLDTKSRRIDYEKYMYDLIKSIEKQPVATKNAESKKNGSVYFRKLCLSILDFLGFLNVSDAKKQNYPVKTINNLKKIEKKKAELRRNQYENLKVENLGDKNLAYESVFKNSKNNIDKNPFKVTKTDSDSTKTNKNLKDNLKRSNNNLKSKSCGNDLQRNEENNGNNDENTDLCNVNNNDSTIQNNTDNNTAMEVDNTNKRKQKKRFENVLNNFKEKNLDDKKTFNLSDINLSNFIDKTSKAKEHKNLAQKNQVGFKEKNALSEKNVKFSKEKSANLKEKIGHSFKDKNSFYNFKENALNSFESTQKEVEEKLSSIIYTEDDNFSVHDRTYKINFVATNEDDKKIKIDDEIEFLKLFDEWIKNGRQNCNFLEMLDQKEKLGNLKKPHFSMFLVVFFDTVLNAKKGPFTDEELYKIKTDFFQYLEKQEYKGTITYEEKQDLEEHFFYMLAKKQSKENNNLKDDNENFKHNNENKCNKSNNQKRVNSSTKLFQDVLELLDYLNSTESLTSFIEEPQEKNQNLNNNKIENENILKLNNISNETKRQFNISHGNSIQKNTNNPNNIKEIYNNTNKNLKLNIKNKSINDKTKNTNGDRNENTKKCVSNVNDCKKLSKSSKINICLKAKKDVVKNVFLRTIFGFLKLILGVFIFPFKFPSVHNLKTTKNVKKKAIKTMEKQQKVKRNNSEILLHKNNVGLDKHLNKINNNDRWFGMGDGHHSKKISELWKTMEGRMTTIDDDMTSSQEIDASSV